MMIDWWTNRQIPPSARGRKSSVWRISLWLVTFMVSSSLTAQSDDTELAVGEEVDPLTEAAILERQQEIQQRQSAIEELQSEFGVYSPVLIEAFADFGLYFTEIGDFASAISAYDSALQVARISNGLYSAEQLPILEDLIESNTQLRDWSEVDKLEHLRYHISSRLFELDDSEYLIAANAYGSWKLRVVRENLLDLGSRGLTVETEDLSQFYDRVITDIEMQTDTHQDDLLQLVYGKSLADMALARVVASTPFTAFQGTASQYISQTRCQNVVNAQGEMVRQCYSVQVENPRYRQSQQDAKQIAVSQYTREVNRSIEKLQAIAAQSTNLSVEQRQSLESHIGELETESTLLLRSSRRRLLY